MGLFLPGNDRRTIKYDAELAEKLGINEAIILEQIIASIEGHIEGHDTQFFRDGRWWMFDSVNALSKTTVLGRDAVRRTIAKLKSLEIIQMIQHELAEGRASYWYSINTENLAKLLPTPPPCVQNQTMAPMCAKPEDGGGAKPDNGGAKPDNAPPPMCAKPDNLPSNIYSLNTSILPSNVKPLPIKRSSRAKKPKPEVPPEVLALASSWRDYAIEELDGSKPHKSWTLEYFAQELQEVIEQTGLDIAELWNVLNFVRKDKPPKPGDFGWYDNATSPRGLLKVGSNGKRKIENIRTTMKNPHRRAGYERSKSVDYSADNGKFDHVNDQRPWE